ncbi:MAG: virulence RhuM family protein [Bacteroidales bacterium]|nr:virulence RhuM family protein [Bacteroidales bacterium]
MPIGNSNEIVIYQPDDTICLEVRMDNETVWLTQAQMVTLFQSSKANISEHIKSIYNQKELERESTVRFFRTVQKEGARSVSRTLEHYNLDMIISVDYRVNTKRGILFRKWATEVLKSFFLKGYVINEHLFAIDAHLRNHDLQLENLTERVNIAIQNNSLPPVEGIFYDGQIFDAYTFVSDLVRSAKERIVLFDNYLDDTVLTMLDKRGENVSAIIITKAVSSKLELDLAKHNAQYRPIEIKKFDKVHDRFLCIDSTVYHIGASLKDLGKKWFAFSKMEMEAEGLLSSVDAQ